MAVTDPDAEDPYRRASMIIVPTDTPGFELVGNISVMGDRGADWAEPRRGQLPGRARAAREPARRRRAWASSSPRSGSGRGASTTACAGSASASAPSTSCAGTPRRASSRPASRSGTRQMVQQWIAESRAEIHAARLMVLHAAWKIEQEGRLRGARGDLAHQVHRGPHPAAGARPRHPGARRAGHDRRHAAGLLVRARARRRASTTAPTRCTSPAWRGASCTGTPQGAGVSGERGGPAAPRRGRRGPARRSARPGAHPPVPGRGRSRASRAPSPSSSSARGTPT